jgi:hypothetical protein
MGDRRRLGPGWWLIVASGCGGIGSELDYAQARAEAECGQMEQCELGRFESEYTSLEDCVNQHRELIEDSNRGFGDLDCEYVPDEAGHCVSRIRWMSCEEWRQGEAGIACDLVWNCTDVFDNYYYGF